MIVQGLRSHSEKKLSIIVTAHNLEDLIGRCLKSIIECLYKVPYDDYEVLMIDDNSSDLTTTILKMFESENESFHYVKTSFHNIGKVRNYGVNISRGKYITFIDGDDSLAKFNMGKVISLLDDNSPDILLSKMHEVFKPSEEVVKAHIGKPIKLSKNKAIQKFLIHKDFQAHLWGKFLKRDLFYSLRFPEVTCYEDALAFPILLNNCEKIYYIDEKIYNYIKHSGSLSSYIDSDKADLMADAVKCMFDTFGAHFNSLTACHAIDLVNKHKEKLSKEKYDLLVNRLNSLSKIKFYFDPKVRMSFKRKLFSIKL
ncbi:glycosyltransferase family 2 protein [Photorhabdus tasmaniensis]|uniref:Glycosyltransferase 2-like domain-containing protein n=1 Tax=Photorhabdus tasmaniensis TaxID=1004159 RepID=A0ABX0GND0_9GAMM|nr:glycosyltransferase family 2 protein [Photorhabdus tasmaniensis]NHB90361.1 hypothetical protein [Photorhabdus tasmaniensis]